MTTFKKYLIENEINNNHKLKIGDTLRIKLNEKKVLEGKVVKLSRTKVMVQKINENSYQKSKVNKIFEDIKTMDDIIEMYPTAIRQFFDTGEMEDSLYDALYNYYLDSGDMPYGVAKARDGDPQQWIADHFERDFKDDGNSIRESENKTIDMTGEKCNSCGKGKYKETSMHDDMDGVLHCSNCGDQVKRYKKNGKDLNESYSKKLVTALTAAALGTGISGGTGATDIGNRSATEYSIPKKFNTAPHVEIYKKTKPVDKPNASKFSNYNDDDLLPDDPANRKVKETQISELMKLAGVNVVQEMNDVLHPGDPIIVSNNSDYDGSTGTLIDHLSNRVVVRLDSGDKITLPENEVSYNHEADELEDEARGKEGYEHGEDDVDDQDHEFDEQIIHVNKNAFESIDISNGKLVIKGEKIIPTLDRKNRIWTANIWSSKKIF